MPELPEVEVIRRGLASHITGRRIASVEVLHERATRRHVAGSADLTGRLQGARIESVERRGKFLWLVLADLDEAVVVHLGMSGQMLIDEIPRELDSHCRIVARLDDGSQVRFVDQRTFGGWWVDPVVSERDQRIPLSVSHIGRDLLDPAVDLNHAVRTLRRKQTEIKRGLLDQTVVSGIGNIYADESLWRASLHGRRRTDRLRASEIHALLGHARDVMTVALSQGGTSFDSLYVNVNGQSGYFARSLNAYGREGEACHRCGATMARESFMNRSSYFCPVCQRRPRAVQKQRLREPGKIKA